MIVLGGCLINPDNICYIDLPKDRSFAKVHMVGVHTMKVTGDDVVLLLVGLGFAYPEPPRGHVLSIDATGSPPAAAGPLSALAESLQRLES